MTVNKTATWFVVLMGIAVSSGGIVATAFAVFETKEMAAHREKSLHEKLNLLLDAHGVDWKKK